MVPVSKTQLFFFSGICTVILWQDYCGKGNLRKSYWNIAGRKFQIGNVSSFIVKKVLFLSVYVDDIKLAGKKHNIDPMWKVLNKEVDLGEPTSFLDHVYLGCTQRQCEISKDVVDNHRNFVWIANFRERNRGSFHTLRIFFFLHGLIMDGHARKWVEGYCELANKTNSTTLQSIYSMTTTSKKKKWNLLDNCPSMLSNCSEMLIFGKNWTTWYFMVSEQTCTINHKMDRSPVTDAWIDWFLTFIIHVNKNNIVMWVILHNNADWDCFKTPILREILRIQNPTSGGTSCIFGSCTFVPISWMCKKQTSVSHSSTESEIISLDAGLRLDGIPALDLWDLIVSVLGNMTQTTERPGRPRCHWQESKISRDDQRIEQHWLCSLKRPVFASRSFVVCVWGQRSSDQDDH